MNLNKIILLGGIHHNGLGLARSFGRHGIKSYGIIIGKKANDSFVAKSKYWEKTWAVETEEDALEIIIDCFSNESKKPVVIPRSDGAAKLIDDNLNKLKDSFILPSINGIQGEILRLMNKEEQIVFAKENGLRMLPSYIYDINMSFDNTIDFPVILKPVTSVEGKKADMSICYGEEEFENSIEDLKKRGFKRILVQKYLEVKTEYLLTGAISNRRYSFSLARNIRQWPPFFGTFSFSETTLDEGINLFCCDVLGKLFRYGYRGPIDIEIFCDSFGEIYVNEFNWRSSGRNFISKYTGVESAYMYYCDQIGVEYDDKMFNEVSMYIMNEVTDIKHVLKRDITLKEWINDLRKVKSYAVWDDSDPKPAYKRYRIMVSRFIRGATRK